MTFKEKLEIDHPENISKDYVCSCFGCPCDYDYELRTKSVSNCGSNGGKGCEYCWNREMEDTKVKAEMKKEFDWEEFKNKLNKIAVHCKTEEEANDFCKQMHEHGMKWNDGISYLSKNMFHSHKEVTAYDSDGCCCYVDWYKRKEYRILEWSDYMSIENGKEQAVQEFTRAELKDGMVVELRNEDMYLVLGNKLITKNDYHLLNEYNECLKEFKRDNPSYDIQKVFKIITKNIYYLDEIFYSDNLELIWERNEVKEMTVEEMKAKLEELTGEKIEIKY